MKCSHLLAVLVLAACGLDTGALPAKDAGVDADANGGGIAGSPATWPSRRRLTPLVNDAGATNPANKPGGKQPSAGGQAGKGGQGGQTQPSAGGSAANPSGTSNPNGQATPGGQTPSNSGKGGQAKPSGQAGSGTSQPSGGNHGSQSSADAGMGTPSNPGSSAGGNNSSGGSSNGGKNPGSNGSTGNGGQGPTSGPGSKANSNPVDNTIDGIVDLVLAILDLSFGPVRPVEIEQLVSAILVLSLAPAELAADSLIAVLDALDGTHICRDNPDRCNPLCENLESDCSVCGHDQDCIDRVEEMCHVKLPRRCH